MNSTSSACEMVIIGNLVFISARMQNKTTSSTASTVLSSDVVISMPSGVTIKSYSDWSFCVCENSITNVKEILAARVQVDPNKNSIINFQGTYYINTPYTLNCWFWADIDESKLPTG